MIDINTYRSRIGQFSQRVKSRKYLYRTDYPYKYYWNENSTGKNVFIATKVFFKICIILVLLSGSTCPSVSDAGQLDQALQGYEQVRAVHGGGTVEEAGDQHIFIRKGKQSTSNFLARYTNGNVR